MIPPRTKKKKRKTRKKQKGGAGKEKFSQEDLAKFLDYPDENFLHNFYYSDNKIEDTTMTPGSYEQFNKMSDSFKITRRTYIESLITALEKFRETYFQDKELDSKEKILKERTENAIHILQMLNANTMWEAFRNIFVPDNIGSYSNPRDYYLKKTDVIMTTAPNPLGFALDLSKSNVLQNTQFEVVEEFPGSSLDRILHAFYNVENDIYLKLLLGDGKSDELKRILTASPSQRDVFSYASSNPIIRKGANPTTAPTSPTRLVTS